MEYKVKEEEKKSRLCSDFPSLHDAHPQHVYYVCNLPVLAPHQTKLNAKMSGFFWFFEFFFVIVVV